MGLFTGSAGHQDTTSNQTQTYVPDNATMQNWGQILGGAQGIVYGPQGVMNNMTPMASVAAPGGLTGQYWNQAGAATGAPDMSGLQSVYGNLIGTVGQMGVDPGTINFNVPGLDFNNPFAGGVPQISAPGGGPSGLASSYLVNPGQVGADRVSAERISAPGGVDPISGLMQVYGPQLQQYQMGPAQQVSAPQLRDFQMNAAAPVSPTGLASTQSWTDPGTAAEYMSPYMQQVLDVQKQQATEDYQQQLEQQRSGAVAAGAYGGSRQAVQEATGQRDLQRQLAQIQATGLQSAYQQGQQQFNQQQQLSAQNQQFNIGTGLQASLANQQAQQQANLQNLSAYLQTQGLGAQTGLQAALANQAAGLTVGGQNLNALLGVQGLGAQLGMQGQLANQQQGLQAALANQQAQEFQRQQQMQASLANQQTGLQAGLANQQTGLQGQLANQQSALQAGLAAQQLGFQGSQFGAQQGLQAALANQAAQQQALGMQYQGGLQAAMQGQQLGLSAEQLQQQLQQQQQMNNLAMTGQMGQLTGAMGNQQLAGYGAGLQGLAALQQAALGQQGYLQQGADVAYQNAMQNFSTPFQALQWLGQMQSMAPLPYIQTGSGTSSTTYQPPQSSIFSQLIGGAMAGAGLASGMGWKPFATGAEGGAVREHPSGLGVVVGGRYAKGGKVHADAPEDRAQMLALLREKGLVRRKAGGGLAAVRAA